MTRRLPTRHFRGLPFAAALVLLPAIAVSASAVAQERYPSRPVRIVVGFAPGGPTDVQARLLAGSLGPALGQSVVVENKPGASTTIAVSDVARAAPDGHTVYFGGSGAFATTPLTVPNLPYDPVRSFRPVAMVGEEQIAFAVSASIPATRVSDLVALIQSNPGKYAFGSSGQGNITHLTGELFKLRGGRLDMAHVAYKGAAPAVADVLAGHVAMVVGGLSSVYPLHQQQKLRVLAIASERRVPYANDIPTMIESGMKDFISTSTFVLLAPAGTPDAVIGALNAAVNRTLTQSTYQQEMRKGFVEPILDSTPEATARLLARELDQWTGLVQTSGLQVR